MWAMIGIGAIGAGLFLTLREFFPWLEAKRSGVVRSRGARQERIERATDAERFAALTKHRLKGMSTGLLVIVAGLVWLVWNGLGFWLEAQP